MPPQNQRRSSSAEDLDEYLKFQQGQQAKQAMSLQQLGAMFNMSQQQVANEIARANLEIARSGQGIAQGRLDLDIASNPSIIAARAAEATYNQARADGFAEDQASRLAYQAAQTAQIETQTAGQLTANEMAQRVSDSQDTEIEQKIRAGEAEIALKNAQREGVVVSTKDLEARYPYLADKYRLENDLSQTQADAARFGLDYVLPEQARGLRLAGDAQAGENAWQQPFNKQKFALGDVEQARGRQQIQSMRAHDAYGAYDRGLATILQTQPWAMPKDVWQPIEDRYTTDTKFRQAVINKDKAQQAGGSVPLNTYNVPPEFQETPEIKAMLEKQRQKDAAKAAYKADTLRRIETQKLYRKLNPFTSTFDIFGNMQLENDMAAQRKIDPSYTGL